NGVLHVAHAPSSQVDAVDGAACDATDLTVHWSRTDGESGPVTYSVLFTDDGGPLQALVIDTPATSTPFTGVLGHTYGFFSVERHQASTLEAFPPPVMDITYTIAPCNGNDLAVTKVKAAKTVTLSQNTPAKLVPVKVEIQNRSGHDETIPDAV